MNITRRSLAFRGVPALALVAAGCATNNGQAPSSGDVTAQLQTYVDDVKNVISAVSAGVAAYAPNASASVQATITQIQSYIAQAQDWVNKAGSAIVQGAAAVYAFYQSNKSIADITTLLGQAIALLSQIGPMLGARPGVRAVGASSVTQANLALDKLKADQKK